MAQQIKCLPQKCEDLCSNTRAHMKKLIVAAQAFNPSGGEEETS